MITNLRVVCKEDCGNAPRKEILKNLTIAFVTQDLPFVQEWLSESIIWNIPGDKQVVSKENVLENISSFWNENPLELHIAHIITHGKTASINGQVKFSSDKIVAFCDVFEFVSAGKSSKIKEITSYRV